MIFTQAARHEERWDAKATRLKFATDGWLLRCALLDPLFRHYSVVIVDEAQERSTRQDLLLGLLKKVQRRRAELGDPLRVVVVAGGDDPELQAAARAPKPREWRFAKSCVRSFSTQDGGYNSATFFVHRREKLEIQP